MGQNQHPNMPSEQPAMRSPLPPEQSDLYESANITIEEEDKIK